MPLCPAVHLIRGVGGPAGPPGRLQEQSMGSPGRMGAREVFWISLNFDLTLGVLSIHRINLRGPPFLLPALVLRPPGAPSPQLTCRRMVQQVQPTCTRLLGASPDDCGGAPRRATPATPWHAACTRWQAQTGAPTRASCVAPAVQGTRCTGGPRSADLKDSSTMDGAGSVTQPNARRAKEYGGQRLRAAVMSLQIGTRALIGGSRLKEPEGLSFATCHARCPEPSRWLQRARQHPGGPEASTAFVCPCTADRWPTRLFEGEEQHKAAP